MCPSSPSARAFSYPRMRPPGHSSRMLSGGIVLIVTALALFGAIAEDVVTGDRLTLLDKQLANWLHVHARPALTSGMLVFTELHSLTGVVLASTLVAILLYRQRHWFWLQALALAVPGGMVLNVVVKLAFARARPSFSDPLLVLSTFSFPSGHAVSATVFYGVVGTFLASKIDGVGLRVLVLLAALLMVALVSFSRIYLGVHYLSDVLGGVAEGIAWLAICFTALYWIHGKRAAA